MTVSRPSPAAFVFPGSPVLARPLAPLLTPPGVYAPQADTFLLAQALRREGLPPGTEVLDVGTGNGTVALCAARIGARVTATDIAWRAVLTARLNALCAGRHVRVHRGDLFAPVIGRSFDVVVSNPPYVPTPRRRPPRRGASRSWDAGLDGRAVLDRICEQAPLVLRPGGVLLLVHSDLNGVGATLDRLTRAGLRAEVADRLSIPFGPVLRSRLPWLRASGLVSGHQEHEEHEEHEQHDENEELVIIRAEQP